MKGIHETTVTRMDDNAGMEVDVPVRVFYSFTPGYPGCWYLRNGDPGHPPEPAEVEIERVTLFNDSEIKLSDAEYERIEDEIIEREEGMAHERRVCADEERADALREERLFG